jgi:predicted nicotinamide N-methyase
VSHIFLPDSTVTSTDYPDRSLVQQARPLVAESRRLCVRHVSHDALTPDQREAAIRLAGDLVVRHMHMAQEDSANYFLHRGNGDRARLSMEALERGRSCGGSGNGE